MLTLRSIVLIATLCLGGAAAADSEFYFSLRGAFGDVDGPRLTAGTDLSTFGTAGTMFAFGVNAGAYRVEVEFQGHGSEFFDAFFFIEDRIEIDNAMLNIVLDPLHDRSFRPLVGAGFGFATVQIDIDNCYDFNGCGPASPDTHQESTAFAIQYMAGLAFRPEDAGWEIGAYYRWLRSSELQMTTDLGAAYAVDRLEMSMLTFEASWFF